MTATVCHPLMAAIEKPDRPSGETTDERAKNKGAKNMNPRKERLIYEILSVVEEIPPGRVATYGQIARLIG